MVSEEKREREITKFLNFQEVPMELRQKTQETQGLPHPSNM